MFLGHDTELALRAVVDLVNTAPETLGDERLDTVAALREFVRERSVSGVSRIDEDDLAAIRTLRRRFHSVFRASDQRTAVELLNAIVADVHTTPRLTDHDGYGWHIHYFAPGARLAERLAADCGMALAMVLSAGELERLRVCEAPDCGRVLIDLSRNRCRRYCDSQTCGNRLHVAAYRARLREAARATG